MRKKRDVKKVHYNPFPGRNRNSVPLSNERISNQAPNSLILSSSSCRGARRYLSASVSNFSNFVFFFFFNLESGKYIYRGGGEEEQTSAGKDPLFTGPIEHHDKRTVTERERVCRVVVRASRCKIIFRSSNTTNLSIVT